MASNENKEGCEPYSQNLPLPPNIGWKSADKLARGEPTIKYILKEEGRLEVDGF